MFGGGGVAAVDAAHELVEGISQAGLMPLAVVPVGDGGGLAAVRGEEIVVVGAVVDCDAGGGDGLSAHGQQLEVVAAGQRDGHVPGDATSAAHIWFAVRAFFGIIGWRRPSWGWWW
ncbi:hypothetical protein GCM10010206_77180 [Streptomyces cinerochromogenes]|nr:hypothetical protein GCM10010206_77180 [Streptomyces cinerochromogenes]